MSSKVKVAVRVRPLNKRELEMATDVVIDMRGDQTFLKAPKNEKKAQRTFAFDHCFWSMDANNEKFDSQEKVFGCLGTDVLENAFNGYNACIFAYGQTGSGKSYTMMGAPGQTGLIPRICDSLFEQIKQNDDPLITYKVEVSYMEIYNEKVRDLLCPKSDKHNLKVREHKILGPYVDGLSKLVVHVYNDIENLMSEGNKSRTVAATSMNAESSRSHAVFSVVMTQCQTDEATGIVGERVAKISLVDLAGSERASKTNASGDRLKEGSNINKSLTTLGLVISALADQASGKAKSKKGFVPYRDSVLTWLLKDNLGGNSRTVMVATISPAGDNYEETLSTLRYADRAKRIENHAVINEDPNAALIRELRGEVEKLKQQLLKHGIVSNKEVLQEALDQNEKLMQEASLTWEQKEKQTERIHQERHKILKEMGISIQDAGIAVEQGRYYLVNLNADPSLNEMLVYYLKDHTKVGKHDAPELQDIQLNGLGLQQEHCIIDIDNIEDVAYLVPFQGARTCVNGQVVTERTQLRHGDRILWGNHHFFRINCPHAAPAPGGETEENLDFDFAQNELMLNEFDSIGEPLQKVIQQLEVQHEKEKQGALDQQKEMYEQKLEELRKEKTPDTLMSGRTSSGYVSEDRILNSTPTSFYDSQLLYEESLRRLREEVIRANVLVREANQLSSEMKKDADFAVTLQIPTATLSQAVNQGPLTSEVAVVVKHKSRGTQVWSVDKLGNKIYDMRDAYQTITENPLDAPIDDTDQDGLFFEVECHTLIGVATVWLECLYQNVPLDYSAPVISQQGEVCGRLSVEIRRLQDETTSLSLDGESVSDDEDNEGLAMGSSVKVQIMVKDAHGLPLSLCNYVFCQYNFFDHELAVIPPLNAATSPATTTKTNSMSFDSTKVFTVEIDEDFLDYVTDGSLAIEVYGNRSRGYDAKPSAFTLTQEMDNSKSLVDRWKELSRQLELWVEIHELNEQGFYSPVELLQREGQEAGGVFMLRQGYSRRVVVQCVVPKQNSQGAQGLLPVVIESITNVAVGSVAVRNKTQKGLDSYQERDLQTLRDRFSNSVMKKREYLDQQIQEMINKPNKSAEDKEHEGMLIDQWVSLTEERNAILCPNTGSGVPGSTSEWNPLPGMETHIPVIFLDLDDNALSGCGTIDSEPSGHHSFLSFEQSDSIIGLPIMKYDQKRVTATASWDSSIHDSVYLNRVTQNTERVYIILKVTLRLSSPALVNVVLRKRICVRMYKRPSLKDSLRRKFWRQTNVPTRCGARFELISHIPRQAGEQTEERESLAQKAAEAMHVASGDGEELMDGEAIDKYNKGISHVENILNLHKLRQEVLVKEKLAAVGRSSKSLTTRNMRKFASTPNLFNAPSMSNLWRSQAFPSNNDLNQSELLPPTTNGDANGKQRSTSRASSAGEYLRSRRTNQKAKAQDTRYSLGGGGYLNSPSESPRLAMRHVDIDIDGDGSVGRLTPPRDRLPPRNNTTPNLANLHPLVEHSPHTSELEIRMSDIDISTDAEKEVASRTNSNNTSDSAISEETAATQQENDNVINIFPPQNESNETSAAAAVVTVADEERPRDGETDGDDDDEEDEEDVALSPRLKVGDVVKISEALEGQVRFYGKTQFADGIWVGIALAVAEGKNDGSVNGVSYFNCEPMRGLFIRAEKLLKS